jgi:hypothetical protein
MNTERKKVLKEKVGQYAKNTGYGAAIAVIGGLGGQIRDFIITKKENNKIEILEKANTEKDIKIAKLEEGLENVKNNINTTNNNITALINKL